MTGRHWVNGELYFVDQEWSRRLTYAMIVAAKRTNSDRNKILKGVGRAIVKKAKGVNDE